MNISVTLFFLFTIQSVIGQDTTFFNNKWKPVKKRSESTFIYVVIRNKNYPDSAIEKTFYKNGNIRYERFYYAFDKGLQYGKDRKWYENGNLHEIADYDGKEVHGRLLTYWDNGNLRRNDSLIKGKFVSGKCFTRQGKDTSHFEYTVMPFLDCYPGTELDDHLDFISKNLKYPPISKKNKIQGDVYIRMTIESDGSVTNAKIDTGINSELNKEALRVVRSMPKWVPGSIDGVPSKFYLSIPVSFDLSTTK
jgi:TonB family protein